MPISGPRHTTSRRTLLQSTGALTAGAVGTAGAAALGAPAQAAPARGADLEWPPGPGRKLRPQPVDAQLARMLKEVDPARIRRTVEKLASFGPRHTLSSQDDPERAGFAAGRVTP